MITATNLSKRYGNTIAVDSINFVEVDPPEPEKAGKSSAGPQSIDISQSFSK